MTCKTCKHVDKSREEMTQQGFAACKKGEKWIYYPPTHSCSKYQKEKK